MTPLDPERLDEIVRELDLQDAGAIDRFQLWYRDLLRTLWDWLKNATGGDDGWLERLGDWLTGWLSSLAGGTPIEADTIINSVMYLTAALLIVGFAYLCWRLWQLHRPARSDDAGATTYLQANRDLVRPLSELPVQLWAPAMFSQVCIRLADRQLVNVRPNTTNGTIARDANLPPSVKVRLAELADAADRALFAGWAPAAADIRDLQAHRDAVLDSLEQRD